MLPYQIITIMLFSEEKQKQDRTTGLKSEEERAVAGTEATQKTAQKLNATEVNQKC